VAILQPAGSNKNRLFFFPVERREAANAHIVCAAA
jgi:hypothetical protein